MPEHLPQKQSKPPRHSRRGKAKVITAPKPDPRILPYGTPAVSYVLAGIVFGVLLTCAQFVNGTPVPGDRLAVPAGAIPSNGSGHSVAPPEQVTARLLGNVLSQTGPACTLSESALRAQGGSFAVLATRPDGMVLSWAGGATAANAPCPAGQPILVSRAAYQSLQDWRPAPAYQR